MLKSKKLFVVGLLSANVFGSLSSMAMDPPPEKKTVATQAKPVELPLFDLEGDGHLKPVKLPFDYYKREANDHLTLIHQGGYKVYDIQKDVNEVAIVGTLMPCIAITATDGKKFIAFHKHWTNSLTSLKEIIEAKLDLSDKNNVFARIYTTRNDLNWKEYNWGPTHNNCTPLEEVKRIKDFLEKNVGIIRYHIPANLYNLLENNKRRKLGHYALSELSVAVQMNDIFNVTPEGKKEIKFMSTDLYVEDVLNLKGTNVTYAQYYGDHLPGVQARYPNHNFTKMLTPYNKIPEKWLNEASIFYKEGALLEENKKRGYMIQMRITLECINQNQQELYKKHLNIEKDVLKKSKFGTLPFYPITQ